MSAGEMWTDRFGIDPEYASLDKLHYRLGAALDATEAALEIARRELGDLSEANAYYARRASRPTDDAALADPEADR